MADLTLPSYAKINVGLRIIRKRTDGFHELDTILTQIDLHDELSFTAQATPNISLTCTRTDLPTDESNLCVRAAKLLQRSQNVTSGVHMELSKHIPMGAGLGGGSSNAAVVLLGLNKLWRLNLNAEQLEELASQLGSDVPFFIRGGSARATGRGEMLAPVNLQIQRPIVIVYPQITISTNWAYSQVNLDLTKTKKNITLPHFEGSVVDSKASFSSFKNDFEAFIFPAYPELSKIKALLDTNGALFSSLSGSGSALFGIFDERNQAEKVATRFKNECVTFVAHQKDWGFKNVQRI